MWREKRAIPVLIKTMWTEKKGNTGSNQDNVEGEKRAIPVLIKIMWREKKGNTGSNQDNVERKKGQYRF